MLHLAVREREREGERESDREREGIGWVKGLGCTTCEMPERGATPRVQDQSQRHHTLTLRTVMLHLAVNFRCGPHLVAIS
jgi:hypothetical protein